MTSPSTARRWLGILARHYPSLLVSGVCHNAVAELDELEQHAEILRRDCHEFRAERDRLREALIEICNMIPGAGCTDAVSTDFLCMVPAEVKAALKETSK